MSPTCFAHTFGFAVMNRTVFNNLGTLTSWTLHTYRPLNGSTSVGNGIIDGDIVSSEAYMIALTCRRCGSTDIRKNGHTKQGRQKMQCNICNFHSTIDTKMEERAKKMADVERLHHERVSQRGIARVTGVSRSTIIKWLKKKT